MSERRRLVVLAMLLLQVESKFLASQAYGLDKSRFHFFDSAFDLVIGLASNLLGWMPWVWDVSAGLVAKAGFDGWGGDIPTSICFVVLTMIMQVRPFVLKRNRQVTNFAPPLQTHNTAVFVWELILLDCEAFPLAKWTFASCRPTQAERQVCPQSLTLRSLESYRFHVPLRDRTRLADSGWTALRSLFHFCGGS